MISYNIWNFDVSSELESLHYIDGVNFKKSFKDAILLNNLFLNLNQVKVLTPKVSVEGIKL
jgi:hypothetical protein